MKQKTMDKLCASYMEDARGVKPLSWTVGKYEMLANTFVGIFSVCPLLKGGFAVIYNGETLCTRSTLSKAKEFANEIYKQKIRERLGI